eukprot:TRINITY_DN4559_c0_g1_i3.p1 TRINITY_DN4559_c0_g1~~TRINITY_DN4559_c0_g1_i3.p1  ORF type:complete len:168 (+),score=24.23 TRINITY_DN4559_c0_g1_i3:181-684(+)
MPVLSASQHPKKRVRFVDGSEPGESVAQLLSRKRRERAAAATTEAQPSTIPVKFVKNRPGSSSGVTCVSAPPSLIVSDVDRRALRQARFAAAEPSANNCSEPERVQPSPPGETASGAKRRTSDLPEALRRAKRRRHCIPGTDGMNDAQARLRPVLRFERPSAVKNLC